jgi:hypothetical protein
MNVLVLLEMFIFSGLAYGFSLAQQSTMLTVCQRVSLSKLTKFWNMLEKRAVPET